MGRMNLALMTAAAYLIGSFPTGVVLSRRRYGIDVREMGSGNIGATNITRTFGWYAGALTFLVDALKGFLPLSLVLRYFPGEPWAAPAVGIALVAGHCFSAYLRLRGGKGVATSLGALAVVTPWGALAAALTYAVLLGVTRISALGSLGGLAAINLYLLIAAPPIPVVVLTAGVSVLVLVRHHSNIRRLWKEFRERKVRK